MNQDPGHFSSSVTRKTGELYRVAIVGAGTLKGKEMAEILPQSALPVADVKLLDDDETLGQVEPVGDEVTFVQSVSRENFDNIDFTFFASRPSFTRGKWHLARDAGSMILDLSYALEGEPGATIRSPWLERELGQSPAPELAPGPVVVAHPAASVLALLVARANRAAPVRSAVATVFEPASEAGRGGMDELHEQTVNLLSFQELPKKVFDAQVAFNLVSRLGHDATATALEATERRILDHYRKLTAGTLPIPSLMLVQAPIFHGHVFAVHLNLERPFSLGDFSQALAGEHVTIARAPDEMPSNVGVAGLEEALVTVRPDVQNDTGVWLWVAADNLRLQCLTAIECAQRLGAALPRGKVQ